METSDYNKQTLIKSTKKYLRVLFFVALLYISVMYIANIHDCNCLEDYKKQAKYGVIGCSSGYFVSLGARLASTEIAYYNNGRLDTSPFNFGCDKFYKFTAYYHSKKYFVLYTEKLDYIILAKGRKEFALLKELYPDSVKLVDPREYDIVE